MQVPHINNVPSLEKNDEQQEPDGNPCALPQDPYEQFLVEQQEREVQWESQRAAKRRKTDHQCPEKTTEIDDLQNKLDAKTEECERLTRKLRETENASANTHEDLYKVKFFLFLSFSFLCI